MLSLINDRDPSKRDADPQLEVGSAIGGPLGVLLAQAASKRCTGSTSTDASPN